MGLVFRVCALHRPRAVCCMRFGTVASIVRFVARSSLCGPWGVGMYMFCGLHEQGVRCDVVHVAREWC